MPRIDSLLVVLDPTTKRQPALHRAAWLAEALELPLELFIAQYDQFVAGDEKGVKSLIRHTREFAEKLADEIAAEVSAIDVRWERPIDQAIVSKVRDSGASLVVKDTHYHPALKRTIFSNTDWNLIRDCPVPLWLVKDADMAERPQLVAAVDPLCAHDKPAALDRQILALGRRLAEGLGGDLTAVHVFDPAPATSMAIAGAVPGMAMTAPPMPDLVEREKSHRAAALQSLLREEGLSEAQGVLRQGFPADELVHAAADLDADVVLMGAISRGSLKRLFIGSTAERALDRLHCDLLVVKPDRAGT